MCDTVYIPEAKMRNTSLTRNEKKKLLNIDVPYGKISDTMPVITWRENAYTDYWLIEFQRIDITKNDNEKYYIKIYFSQQFFLNSIKKKIKAGKISATIFFLHN